MRKVPCLSLVALGCMFFSAAAPNDVAMAAEDGGLEDCRLIINWDTCNMWNEVLYLAQRERRLEPTEFKATLEEIVDEHAKAPAARD